MRQCPIYLAIKLRRIYIASCFSKRYKHKELSQKTIIVDVQHFALKLQQLPCPHFKTN